MIYNGWLLIIFNVYLFGYSANNILIYEKLFLAYGYQLGQSLTKLYIQHLFTRLEYFLPTSFHIEAL